MIILFSSLIILLLSILMFLGLYLSKKMEIELEKNSPIECGMSPLSPPHSPFSLHFFLIAILFMIFDVELALLIPFPLSTFTNMKMFFISINFFIFILLIGLLYEMKKGALKWVF